MNKYSIMLSSTYVELKDHRQAVREAMLGQQMFPNAMENDAALADQDLIDASLAKVKESKAYVGLISYRYGQTPVCPVRNPQCLSLTELEFRYALKRKIPICMFIMHDEHPVPKREVGKERGVKRKFESFVRLAKKDRIYAEFKSVEDLKAKAVQSLAALRKLLDARAPGHSNGSEEPETTSQRGLGPITTDAELRLAYENTERTRWPCPGARVADLNIELVRFFASKTKPDLSLDGMDHEQLAAHLKLLSTVPQANPLPHFAAILCFCDSPQLLIPQARARFVAGEQGDRDVLLENVEGALHRQVAKLSRSTLAELRTRASFDGSGHRVETREIPEEVIREAISNAVAHRDYNATGNVQVRVTKDLIEIINPGSFPPSFSWDSFLNSEAVSSPNDAAIAYYLTVQLSFEGIGRGFSVYRKFIKEHGKQAISCDVGPGPTVKVRIQRPQNFDTVTAAEVSNVQKKFDTVKAAEVSNVPIRVPTHFLGRDEALAEIGESLKHHAVTVAHGLRGVGKSTLAAAYAEKHRGDYRATWWIRAQTESTMRADLVALGVRLNWVGADAKEEEALATISECLRSEGDGVLLIYDSAVDAATLRPYLPRGGEAKSLVTSNAPAWRGIAAPVELPLWPKKIGADYFIARTGRRAERVAAEALSEALGGLPLAHEQAAAYCERLGISLTEYNKRFEAAPGKLLDTGKDAPGEYHGGRTVTKTFALAIDEAAKLHPAAEPLIVHAALLAPEPIPLFLFSEGREKFGEPLTSALESDGLDTAVAALRTFALVDRESIADEHDTSITTDCIRLNRLVREVAAARAEGEARENMLWVLLEAIAALYPDDVFNDPNSWPRARRLDALALALVGGDATPPEGAEEQAAKLLNSLAGYRVGVLAAYAQARPLLDRALEIRERTLGAEHPDTAESLNNLAYLLLSQGDYEGARPLLERALVIREYVLGPEDPDTTVSLNNLAGLLQSQGDYDGARPLFERALAIHLKVRGAEHPNTSRSLNNLANLLRAQGDYEGARPLLERALAIREKVLGPEHPDTATSLNNLAELLRVQGDYAGAQPLYEQALAIREKVLGAEHPDTATSLNNLALLLQSQGDYEGARPLYERALAIFEKVLGTDHPDTAGSLNNLALLLYSQGDYEGARPLYERALATYEKALGTEHPNTNRARRNFAHLLLASGNPGKALAFGEPALAAHEKLLGQNHSWTKDSATVTADALDALGRADEAAALRARFGLLREPKASV